jgi:hypothetical protein
MTLRADCRLLKSFGPAADQAKQFTAGEVAQNTKPSPLNELHKNGILVVHKMTQELLNAISKGL